MTAMLFGKLPAHGDFVSRGIAADRRDAIDAWLAGEMAEARAALGEGFEAAYDSAPSWCFAFSNDTGWVAGAMAPSVDAVGRRFPLLVATAAPDDATRGGLALACGDAIYAALSEGWDADRLYATLDGLEPVADAEPAEPGWWIADTDGKPVDRMGGDRPSGLLRAMLAERETS